MQPTASNRSTPTQLLQKPPKKKNSTILSVAKQQRSMWAYACEFNRLVEIPKLMAVNFIQFSIQLNAGFRLHYAVQHE